MIGEGVPEDPAIFQEEQALFDDPMLRPMIGEDVPEDPAIFQEEQALFDDPMLRSMIGEVDPEDPAIFQEGQVPFEDPVLRPMIGEVDPEDPAIFQEAPDPFEDQVVQMSAIVPDITADLRHPIVPVDTVRLPDRLRRESTIFDDIFMAIMTIGPEIGIADILIVGIRHGSRVTVGGIDPLGMKLGVGSERDFLPVWLSIMF